MQNTLVLLMLLLPGIIDVEFVTNIVCKIYGVPGHCLLIYHLLTENSLGQFNVVK